ncbi:hypothetical protein KP509_01G042900 [Ceratopteris richardii]|uniref:AB hydrolase-1 domain-containing protein n=1 Tax=Ceratopteris richardii TaxID=49495 RepID=A0A8T2VNY5_CERRI|nr:hypothetical protein KP509_01G042900 [Ceratopteris richardii]
MPYCQVDRSNRPDKDMGSEIVQIYYRTYGEGDTKVLLIMGFAATHEAWSYQISGLVGSVTPNEEEDAMDKVSTPSANYKSLHETKSIDGSPVKEDKGMVSSTGVHVCAFDNCGVGKSSAPERKSEYTTKIMAMDALDLMNHLGWRKAHVFGHSLGAMIAFKLAVMFPDRVASLALLSASGGGYECIPKEYVKNISATGLQNKYGQNGQLNACWTHGVSAEEYEKLRTSSILISVIHGRGDVIAQFRHAKNIARKLHPAARLIELPGGHLITHQHTTEVNKELMELIRATDANVPHSQWNKVSFVDEEDEDSKDDQGCSGFVKRVYRWITCTDSCFSWKELFFSRRKLL